jgi:lipooligosaccharide transport system permease protein
VQWAVQAEPLFHAVELLRALTIGTVSATTAWHVVYLVLAGTAAFVVAMRRLERALLK